MTEGERQEWQLGKSGNDRRETARMTGGERGCATLHIFFPPVCDKGTD